MTFPGSKSSGCGAADVADPDGSGTRVRRRSARRRTRLGPPVLRRTFPAPSSFGRSAVARADSRPNSSPGFSGLLLQWSSNGPSNFSRSSVGTTRQARLQWVRLGSHAEPVANRGSGPRDRRTPPLTFPSRPKPGDSTPHGVGCPLRLRRHFRLTPPGSHPGSTAAPPLRRSGGERAGAHPSGGERAGLRAFGGARAGAHAPGDPVATAGHITEPSGAPSRFPSGAGTRGLHAGGIR